MFNWVILIEIWTTCKRSINNEFLIDDALHIPDLVNITEAKTPDRNVLRKHIFAKKTIIVEEKPILILL